MLYIAENIKIFRKNKDMTQEEVAEVLGVSPQSVSKWERGDTYPDITLLPMIANFFEVSLDSLIGMEKINDRNKREGIFTSGHDYIRAGDIDSAINEYKTALKTFPNDEGIMSDLAMSFALSDDKENLTNAVELCERILSNGFGEKVHHTTRAALCYIYMKIGEKDKAIATAKKLPHIRECRETILSQLENDKGIEDIDLNLKFIAIGEENEQDAVEIDFAENMVPICTEHNLIEKIKDLRNETGASTCRAGLGKLPHIRIRDNTDLPPNTVRIRYYADYMINDKYTDCNKAAKDIISALRKIIKMRS